MPHDPLVPASVGRALRDYRELLSEHGITWGEPSLSYVRMMTFLRFPAVAGRMVPGPDLDEAFRDALTGEPPHGLAVLRITPDGHRLRHGPARAILSPEPLPLALLVDSARRSPVRVTVDGTPYEIKPGGARLLDVTTGADVRVEGEPVGVAALTRPAAPARLRLRAGFPCRWTVVSPDGQGWYPPGVPHRRDGADVPFFHGDDLVVDVPAERLTVRVARGMEWDTAETTVVPRAGEETPVALAPRRIHDAAARGWYGADLHVHMNWAGDLVASPAEAAAAQLGEDLHVLNLVAGNVGGERVYDQEALRHWAGRDLPWSDAAHLARMGVEYRNDLFGHVHAFGLAAPPPVCHTGFGSDADWPPNGSVIGELREPGAALGYAHPFHGPVTSPEDVIGDGRRDCTGRALVVDAALGLVDGVELLHFSDMSGVPGSVTVYRRLLGAGCRLAALAGTDTMLSFTRQETVSSPPGWERVYARPDGPLTAESYARALRRGRTFVTTGPWLELEVDGRGPGETLEPRRGDRVTITARSAGPEVERLEIRTAAGRLAEGPGGELRATLDVTEATYVVAVAAGGRSSRSPHRDAFAHTSPVYLDVDGRRVGRPDDVRWCLRWLELLDGLVRGRARLRTRAQLRDHLDLIEKARAVYESRL
ncbi:CehA/McbA family metallohydrolase [Microbispora sp. RL4-1S]|uniref:CehA/McbA family metallohydrolase n=1 Tax=Microbispora oryzae TaxID=2806554 RepID=A0A940WIV9_9ACTN|nr:CehA/McbA family metallohydrolase [Microbispora oryzae]MBP2704062.1 CehA/McbA family metallohydrolase [Microbispora oryzae]